MDDKQAYKQALEKAREIYEKVPDSVLGINLVRIFPELSESEDERVRKDIMILVKDWWDRVNKDNISTKEQMIAWLEKQKDTNVLIQEASEKAYTEGIRVERKHWLEKQDEQKPILDFKACNWYVSKVDGKIHDITYNSTDKVEPKFKFGDWIVNNNSKDVFLIKSTNSGYCTLESIKGNIISPCLPPCESESHIWTIQDAKDGDILVASDGSIFIFKEVCGTSCKHYIAFAKDNLIQVNYNLEHFWESSRGVHPATEEQKELLFQKMREAGYEWDADIKELKKINSYCQENCKGYQETGKCFADGGCDAKHKAEQKSTAWSDKDEENLNGVVGVVERREMTAVSEQYKDILHEYVRWLKSLKDKLQPQPKTT